MTKSKGIKDGRNLPKFTLFLPVSQDLKDQILLSIKSFSYGLKGP